MHEQAKQFVSHVAAIVNAGQGMRVLEMGSRDVNGTVRPLFSRADSYLGIDAMGGPGVNILADAATFSAPFDFHLIVTCETLEHATDPAAICKNALKLLKPGGLFVITAADEKRKPHSAIDGAALRDGEHYQPITRELLADALAGFGRFYFSGDETHGDIYALAIK